MKSVIINSFDRGLATDRYDVGSGQFALAKQFDCLASRRKLQPLRGMTAHTSSTGIGNLIVASDGLMYGSGEDASNPGNGKLWVLAGYGASDDFGALSTNQLAGAALNYDFFVDWADAGNSRKIHWAANNLLVASNYSGGGASATTQALTFTSIGQGLVHPKDKNLYFPYIASAGNPKIGIITPNATPFSGLSGSPFALPSAYRAYCLSHYGNYLAIPLTGVSATSLVNSNIVALWDRDTSQTTFSETISWGNGVLKVLNNLNEILVGVSEVGSAQLQAGTSQDANAIKIKGWAGGFLFEKTIKATSLSGGSGQPSVVINQRVNFIQNNRLYFSATINPNDGIQPSRIGVFSVGKNEAGEWTVTMERVATNANTETGIIACAIVGDYVEMVHTAAGTLTKSTNGNASSSTYGATSVYESGVNPNMDAGDKLLPKKLHAITCHFEPLPSGATVTVKYRVDSKGSDSDWVTVVTEATDNAVSVECPKPSSGFFTDGRNYEFRVESVGGAVITGFGYRYDTQTSLLTK